MSVWYALASPAPLRRRHGEARSSPGANIDTSGRLPLTNRAANSVASKSQKKSVQITHFRGYVRCNRSVAFATQEMREMFLYFARMLIKEVTKSSMTYSDTKLLDPSTPAHMSCHVMPCAQ